MMPFEYPNLVTGTDKWTDWWAPGVGISNSCTSLAFVDFGRPLVVGDVLTINATVEFNKLDLAGSNALIYMQGKTAFEDGNYVWKYGNPLAPYTNDYFFAHRGAVFDGVENVSWKNVVHEGNGVNNGKGLRYVEVGFRCDNSGGGVAPCAASHGRTQRRRRAARMGTVGRGGVAVDER